MPYPTAAEDAALTQAALSQPAGGVYLPAGGVISPSAGGAVTSYSLGPISAGADSPLGQFLAGISGISSAYATGVNAVVNAPSAAQAIEYGQTLSQSQLQSLKDSSAGLASDPFSAFGQSLGAVLGTGVATIGRVVGIGGYTAGPGVKSGAQGAVGGAADVAVSAVGGGVVGAAQGGTQGTANALGLTPGSNPAYPFGLSGSTLAILAGGLVLVLLLTRS